MKRPVDKLSGTQNLSLLATGLVWTRWSFVITPRNYLLASVNFFLAGVAGFQISRIVNFRLKEGDSKKQVMDYIINGSDSLKGRSSGMMDVATTGMKVGSSNATDLTSISH